MFNTQTQGNEIIKNFNKDLRFKPIQTQFERLFYSKGLTIGNKFDSSVWFLDGCKQFKCEGFDVNLYMKKLISSLLTDKINLNVNEKEKNFISYFSPYKNEVDSNKKSRNTNNNQENNENNENTLHPIKPDNQIEYEHKNFKIYTCDFITRITEILIYSQTLIDQVSDNLQSHNAYEKIEILSSTIDKLLSKIELEKNLNTQKKEKKEKSFLIFSLHRLNQFPQGEFNFKLQVNEIDTDYNISVYEKRLLSNKVINIDSPYKKMNLYQEFLKKDLIYPDIYLNNIDQNGLFEYMSKNQVYLKKQIGINKQKSQCNNKAEMSKGLNKLKTIGTETFQVEGNNLNNNIQFTKSTFKFEENSGTNLINFKVLVDKNGSPFGEAEESFLDYVILHIDEIISLSKNEYMTYYSCYVKEYKEHKDSIISTNNLLTSSNKKTKSIKELEEYEKYENEGLSNTANKTKIVMSIQTYLVDETKVSIMKRVINIFQEEMLIKKYHENVIDSLLDCYFSEISSKVKKILTENINDSSTGCCNVNGCCII